MNLAKAFDPKALLLALKTNGIKDGDAIVNDALPVIFDWFNSSLTMEAASIPYAALAIPVVEAIEQKVSSELQALESKLGS